ncbi:C39 family peptidase [Lederbergia sp. NSJ-179]|uniref:C39 family peptidase n=1 Tax=Lederbergia sp. NSJ-179 TaxID=2931402 RepID=UPI001FD5F1E7|nr:C39 family peptidase [Lederbergia sp. NSJ-179]MCJ7839331.1 C39 family peptidase [Lederbergia sp. NSJ-179]
MSATNSVDSMEQFSDQNLNDLLVPSSDNTYIVTSTILNVRTGPSREHELIGELNVEDQIEVMGEPINGYYPIEYDGNTAYVNAMFLVHPLTIDPKDRDKPDEMILDIPYIKQRPSLPSGCEATSLAMALNYYGIAITKETIAQEHIYDDAELIKNEDGSIHTWGNPVNGYVGDPFSVGYTIFTNQLKQQADQYVPSIDSTGANLDTLEYFIAEGRPVLVWITNEYEIPNERFWLTKEGAEVYAPNPLHNVVLTGYDQEYVYVNDPEDYGEKNYKIAKEKFEYLYTLMGKKSLVIGNGK